MADSVRSNSLSSYLVAEPAAATGHDDAVDHILDAVRQHLGMEIAFASRIADGRRHFTHIRADFPVPAAPGDSEPLEDTFCQRILEGRLPELIHHAPDHEAAHEVALTAALPIGSHLNVPLRLSDGKLYGTFCCLSRHSDRSLTERDLNTLRAFADLAAVQIETELKNSRAHAAAVERITGAIAHGQPAIVLQPIHRLDSNAPVGVEALARFRDSGHRSPSAWFNEAAGVGLAVDLELAAVNAALQSLPYVPEPAYLAVNLSPAVAISGPLEALVDAAPADRLVLEITEHAEVEDYTALKRALDPLRGKVRIAIDDVGAGYSGLRHILVLEPDILKLDMSLTRDVDRDSARRALIHAMVEFARDIGCTIVAEGVESDGERAALRHLGVDYAQGWHYSRPLPPVAAQQYLLGVQTQSDSRKTIAPARRRSAAT